MKDFVSPTRTSAKQSKPQHKVSLPRTFGEGNGIVLGREQNPKRKCQEPKALSMTMQGPESLCGVVCITIWIENGAWSQRES